MFLGDYQHTLDAKGRVSLPAKFRLAMTGRLVTVAKGFEGCLYVYPAEDYTRFLEHLTATSTDDFDPNFRQVRRFFTTGADETETDKSGRISISQALREYAGLKREVAVVGNGDRIEIWDADRWAAYNGETLQHIENSAKELADAGRLL